MLVPSPELQLQKGRMRLRQPEDTPLLYSTDDGMCCPRCEFPLEQCSCNPSSHPKDSPGTVRVSMTSIGRKGKTVTRISGIQLPPGELALFTKSIKKLCGAGGSLVQGVIEVQGDHRDKLKLVLHERGWKVKQP